MDYFPRVFSQNDLKWLDNLMPDSGKKKKKRNSQSETENNVVRNQSDPIMNGILQIDLLLGLSRWFGAEEKQ